MNTSTKILLETLFRKLNEEAIDYVVLRNYEGLPDSVGYDVDLAVAEKNAQRLEEVLLSVGKEHQWVVVNREQRHGFHSYVLHSEDSQMSVREKLLRFDVCWSHVWKGTTWLSERRILHDKIGFTSFYVPCPGVEAVVLLLKEILHNSPVKDQYKDRIKKLSNIDPEEFVDVIAERFGRRYAQGLLVKAQAGDWDGILKLRRKLLRALVLRAGVRNPFSTFAGWLGFLNGHMREFLNPPAFFLVLMGPDGVGKTSVANSLPAALHKAFQRHRIFRFRPGLLPKLVSIRLKLFRRRGRYVSRNNPVSSPYRPGSPITSLVRLLYYTLDFVLSYPLLIFLKGMRNLVIFDRYYYEYVIQQPSSGLPEWLPRFLMKLVPGPDAVIYLCGKCEIVLKRKQELAPEEFRDYSARYEALISRLPNAYYVDVDTDLDDVVNKAGDIILNHMAQRFRTKPKFLGARE